MLQAASAVVGKQDNKSYQTAEKDNLKDMKPLTDSFHEAGHADQQKPRQSDQHSGFGVGWESLQEVSMKKVYELANRY